MACLILCAYLRLSYGGFLDILDILAIKDPLRRALRITAPGAMDAPSKEKTVVSGDFNTRRKRIKLLS